MSINNRKQEFIEGRQIMMNKLIIAVSTTVILTAANALIGWITRRVEQNGKSASEKEENPKCVNT